MSEPEIAQPRIELGRSPCAPDVIRGRQPDQPVEGLGHVDQVDEPGQERNSFSAR